jgi:hypothetical protein
MIVFLFLAAGDSGLASCSLNNPARRDRFRQQPVNYEQGLPVGVRAWPGAHCGLTAVVGCGLGDTGAGLQGIGVAEPAAPAWQPGCVDMVPAVSGAGVPFGETLDWGV